MSAGTKIQWCDDTWNTWYGCDKVDAGCKNCYAEVNIAVKMRGVKWGVNADRVRASEATFDAPLAWNKRPWVCDECGDAKPIPEDGRTAMTWCKKCEGDYTPHHRRRVFSLSLGDWLDDKVPIEWMADMLEIIRRCDQLDFLLLTKRPENFNKRLQAVLRYWADIEHDHEKTCGFIDGWRNNPISPSNIWLGTSVSDQASADKRIPELLALPAARRFVSYEPALEAVKFRFTKPVPITDAEFGDQNEYHEVKGIHWLIIGGESGKRSRPFNVKWMRDADAQCKAAGIPVFNKQMGANCWSDQDNFHCPMSDLGKEDVKWKAHLKDNHGGDWEEWPANLRVRQWPASVERVEMANR